MQGNTPAELVRGCLAGDQEAWGELVDRYTPLIYAIARSHRLGSADCEDVVQTTWLRAVQSLEKLRDPERVAQWISTAARRESLKCLAKAGRSLPIGEPAVFDRAGPAENPPEEQLLAAERDDEVLSAFRELKPQCQALLGLLVADPPMSYDQISAALDMPRGSIGPTRSRCLAHLERVLKQRAGRSPQDAALLSRMRESGLLRTSISEQAD